MTIHLQHHVALTKSVKHIVRGIFGSLAVFLSWSVAQPVSAANQLEIIFESNRISVTLDILENFAQNGISILDPFSRLQIDLLKQRLEQRLGQPVTYEQMQRQFNRIISIDPNSPDLINAQERKLLEILVPNSTNEQKLYILRLMAQRGNGQSVIRFLRALPVETLTQENLIPTLIAYNSKPIELNTINATLTADFHYGLYYGQADGSGLTFVGRDLNQPWNNPEPFPWTSPETFSFNANAGDYLYVLAWDGFDPFRSWIGEFKLSNGVSLVSNSTDWEYTIASGVNPVGGDAPSPTELMPKISSASWTIPNAAGFNGTAPWGTISGISPSAQFLVWPNSSTDSAIFRTKWAVVEASESEPGSELTESEPVPEPTSVVGVLVAGVLGVGVRLRRKRQ